MKARFWIWTAVLLCGQLSAQQQVALYGKRQAGTASAGAVRVLEEALRRHGLPARWLESPDARSAQETLLRFDSTAGAPAESFSLRKSAAGGRQTISVNAGDETGMSYGIFELVGQIEAAGPSPNLFQAASEISRTPQVRVRSLAMFLHNRDLERDWFFSRDFWNSYFQLLATSRFNQFTLTFGHQTPYFAPLFPFLIDVPGYERLKTPTYTDEERKKNLATLRMITELANQWGIRFVLGIWQEHAYNYGRPLVDGLDYKDLVDYCPKALAILLKECPRIQGLQLRMNHESGILEEDQKAFFTGMSKAILSVGRPLSVDFRVKGLTQETIAAAQAFGLHLIVSTKYWREHMGLPYHETVIDPADNHRHDHRYGFWDLLPHDRTYDVMFQLWNFGSQKILLWGNLDYTRQFAESTHLGGAMGYEVYAPLSQRGFGNWPGGNWRILSDRQMEYYKWEFERYWAFYLTFGLAGYSAAGPQPILDGEMQKRFGAAAAPVRDAYTAAGWVIPFVTSVRAPSASSFGYWPEMDSGGLTDRYVATDTGDDNLFYRVDDYVKDYLAEKYSARMTPEEMAARLNGWSGTIRSSLERGAAALPAELDRKEFDSTKIDFSTLANLADYHAERLRAARDYEFFARTAERRSLLDAIGHYRKAVDHWAALSRLTDGVYYDHMVFNRPPEQVGHWKDELPFLKVDLARLEQIDRLFVENVEHPKNAESWKIENRQSKMSLQWKSKDGVILRWADTTLQPAAEGFPDRYSMREPRVVIKDLFTDFHYTRVLHKPIRYLDAGTPLALNASLLGARQGVGLKVYYRYAGRGFQFHSIVMTEREPDIYAASVPAGAVGDTLYYYITAVGEDWHDSHGSDKEPHAVAVRAPSTPKPSILHTDVLEAHAGKNVRITATVTMPLKAQTVRLYYRHLDQSEDWRVVEMKNSHGSEYEAVIPGEFIVPAWDIMYAIEACDRSGRGSFYPTFDGRQPFVVAKVSQH